MNKSIVTLTAATLVLVSYLPAGRAQAGEPPAQSSSPQATCRDGDAGAECRRQENRRNRTRLLRAKANIVAAAMGGHRRPERTPQSPMQVAREPGSGEPVKSSSFVSRY